MSVSKEPDPQEDWEPLPPDGGFENIITLVHGTWGRNSALANHNSTFCNSLASTIQGRTAIQIFRWSGRNRNKDRLAASERLRACIAEGADLYPDAKQFLIAHSHGGNVVFYALKDAACEARVQAAVTLSTPFIHVSRRPVPSGLRRSLERVESHRSYFTSSFIFLGFWFALITIPESDHGVRIVLSAAAVVMFALAGASRVTKKRDTELLDRDFRQVEQLLALPASLKTKVLIVTSSADEASGLLTAGSFSSWLSTRVVGSVLLPLIRVKDWLWKTLDLPVLVTTLLVLCVRLYAHFVSPLSPGFLHILGLVWHWPLWVVGGLIIAIDGVTWILAHVCWLSARMFGPEINLEFALLSRMSPEATPPGGPWQIYNVRPLTSRSLRIATVGAGCPTRGIHPKNQSTLSVSGSHRRSRGQCRQRVLPKFRLRNVTKSPHSASSTAGSARLNHCCRK